MKKLVFLMTIAIGLLMGSCAMTKEAVENQNQLQTQVVLDKANYKIIGNVTGEATQKYVFGMGGISKKALRSSAMSDMMNNADLKGGARAIINANVQYQVKNILGIYTKIKAVATGVIIEFTK